MENQEYNARKKKTKKGREINLKDKKFENYTDERSKDREVEILKEIKEEILKNKSTNNMTTRKI